jgi:hypothetical protein
MLAVALALVTLVLGACVYVQAVALNHTRTRLNSLVDLTHEMWVESTLRSSDLQILETKLGTVALREDRMRFALRRIEIEQQESKRLVEWIGHTAVSTARDLAQLAPDARGRMTGHLWAAELYPWILGFPVEERDVVATMFLNDCEPSRE